MKTLITADEKDVKHISENNNHIWYKGQQFISLTRYKEAQEKYLELIKIQEEEIKRCKEKITVLTSYIEILGGE